VDGSKFINQDDSIRFNLEKTCQINKIKGGIILKGNNRREKLLLLFHITKNF